MIILKTFDQFMYIVSVACVCRQKTFIKALITLRLRPLFSLHSFGKTEQFPEKNQLIDVSQLCTYIYIYIYLRYIA